MKIGEILGNSRHITVIKVYCASIGAPISTSNEQNMNGLISKNVPFFAFIDKSGISVFEARERSALLAKIVAGRIRLSKVLYFKNNEIHEITRKNVVATCISIAPQKVVERAGYQPAIRKRPGMFDDGLTERPRKKCRKRGFERTERANASLESFTHI
ncbi:MAG: hypothetical protein LBM08_00805 [Dysgonamonadaceae bacterium]|nr:hypothetical protein [Dysgonamonadaceae bacterium]